MKQSYKIIPLDLIKDPERPLRNDLTHESVADLTASIKQVGIIEPLVVKKKGEGYEVIAGHRRLVAAEVANLAEAPCVVVKVKEMEAEVIKLQENLIRRDISAVEWAQHLTQLKQHSKLSDAKIAETLGMSETWVRQHLAIAEYDEPLLEALEQNVISFSVARELSGIKDPQKRQSYVKYAIRGGCTPALAVRWRKEANREPLTETQTVSQTPDTSNPNNEVEEDLICPVCGEPIKPEEITVLQIHSSCKPEPIE